MSTQVSSFTVICLHLQLDTARRMTIDIYSDTVQTQVQQATECISQLGWVCIGSNQVLHPIDHQPDICARKPSAIQRQLVDSACDSQPDRTTHERYHFERARVRGAVGSVIEYNAHIINAIWQV